MANKFRWLILSLIAIGFALFFVFDLHEILNFSWFKQHHLYLQKLIDEHFFISLICTMVIYIVAVALSVPGATLLTIAIGYLFGLGVGSMIVVFSATLGSALIFIIVRSTLGDWFREKAKGWLVQVSDGFTKNAFSYLLFLRLVPLIPFWVLNIIPALLGMPLQKFILATLIGIIPGTFVYLSVGHSLETVLAREVEPDFGIIFEPSVFLPLLGLGILALVPIIVKRYKK